MHRALLTVALIASAPALFLGMVSRASAQQTKQAPLKLLVLQDPAAPCDDASAALISAQLKGNPRVLLRPAPPWTQLPEQLTEALKAQDAEALLWLSCPSPDQLQITRHSRLGARHALMVTAPKDAEQAKQVLREAFEGIGQDVLRWRRAQTKPPIDKPAPKAAPEPRPWQWLGVGLKRASFEATQPITSYDLPSTQRDMGALYALRTQLTHHPTPNTTQPNMLLTLDLGLPFAGGYSAGFEALIWSPADDDALSFIWGTGAGMEYLSQAPLSALWVSFGPAVALQFRPWSSWVTTLGADVRFNPTPPVGIGWSYAAYLISGVSLDQLAISAQLRYEQRRISSMPTDELTVTMWTPSLLINIPSPF